MEKIKINNGFTFNSAELNVIHFFVFIKIIVSIFEILYSAE